MTFVLLKKNGALYEAIIVHGKKKHRAPKLAEMLNPQLEFSTLCDCHVVGKMIIQCSSGWWFQPISKTLVKMGIFPK